MRRRGFTLIEVLVALMISVAAMLTTLQLGRAWWQTEAENQFLLAFERNWRHLMQQARIEHVMVKVTWNAEARKFRFIRYSPAKRAIVTLMVPASLKVKTIGPTTDIIWHPSLHFTEIRTYEFRRASGRKVTFSSQLGWGELIRHDE
ncbi:prepilin-type N-terminal cleavage/methylation domain-containing protein [Lacticaseibacillus sp. GG6-2]